MVLVDHQIRKLAKAGLISHFADYPAVPRQGVISFGLSGCGYDLTLGTSFRVFKNTGTVVDPKNFDPKNFDVREGDTCVIPPNSFALAESVEYFCIPYNLVGLVLGKSTYARCGIVVNFTPLEPGWRGTVTVEVSNTSPLPAIVYAGEGIGQVLFLRLDGTPEKSYAAKGGKYCDQTGITLPRV